MSGVEYLRTGTVLIVKVRQHFKRCGKETEIQSITLRQSGKLFLCYLHWLLFCPSSTVVIIIAINITSRQQQHNHTSTHFILERVNFTRPFNCRLWPKHGFYGLLHGRWWAIERPLEHTSRLILYYDYLYSNRHSSSASQAILSPLIKPTHLSTTTSSSFICANDKMFKSDHIIE